MLNKKLNALDNEVIAHKTCKKIVYTYRLGNFLYTEELNKIYRFVLKMKYKLLKFVFMSFNNCEIPSSAEIGRNFLIAHNGRGIVIHPKTKIGNNVKLLHEVTIGTTYTDEKHGVPIIGDNVLIGAGAKILGGITIGDNVTIGANSVVLKDVPSGATVGGIPAKILKQS